MIAKQTVPARAVAHQLANSPEKGTPYSAVEFELLDGPDKGAHIAWYGYYTDATTARTMESLRYAGWTGDDLSESPLPGLGSTEVSLVIDHETFKDQTYARVQWVNRAGGLAIKAPMTSDAAKAFAAKMKGYAIQSRQTAGAPNGSAPAAPQTDAKGKPLPF